MNIKSLFDKNIALHQAAKETLVAKIAEAADLIINAYGQGKKLLLCGNGAYYTGIAKDPKKRFAEHASGKGAQYTKSNGAAKLVYSKRFKNHRLAALNEIKIKKLSRMDKIKLIQAKTAQTKP